ncbi:MAG TPA: electron transfer flavoprotein subunit beta/FixA family protein [Verrucomicrobiota bacterium]|jgi:electron transfer flavoprotein beta subunit|nr:electron transfer flavoprotein subunit beta/FixA family protein [Verrucomicrobiota bacterium]HQL76699.1 electron transfer flavoprotein subunit beta/FixA family protein [Verrucomicrobiota bacterium]
MKILVPFKRVADPGSYVDQGAVEERKWIINPFDEIAVEEAIRIKERGEAQELVGATIGSEGAEEQVRTAMAMGLDRAIRVDDSRYLDAYAVSRILEGVVRLEKPDLVLMGKQAVDSDANQTGQMLAGRLSWPQATFVSKIEFVSGFTIARCTRETDSGLEVITVDLPAVVTTDLRLNEPRYVSLPSLMKARRRPFEVLTVEQIGVDVQSRSTVLKSSPTPRRAAGVRLETVEQLVACLRNNDKVL